MSNRGRIFSAEDYAMKNAWGLYTSIDVFNCDKEMICSETAIRSYVLELCKIIDVKIYGDPLLILFGGSPPDPKIFGWSVAQMIETSLVSGHFIQAPRHAYIDIFSCKYYDSKIAIKFTVDYFKGTSFDFQTKIRGDYNELKIEKMKNLMDK